MNEGLRSILVGTSGLAFALAVAALLTLLRGPLDVSAFQRERLERSFLAGLAVQCLHFGEEFLAGFHQRFPPLFGLAAWSPGFFVAFNLFWIAVWLLSLAALRQGRRLALWPISFYVLAMLLNGVAHPVLAAMEGGYFPGLLTAPLAAAMGVWVGARLLASTRSRV